MRHPLPTEDLEARDGSASIQKLSAQVASDLALPDEMLNILHGQFGPQSEVCDVHGLVGQMKLLLWTFLECLIRGLATEGAVEMSEVVEGLPWR